MTDLFFTPNYENEILFLIGKCANITLGIAKFWIYSSLYSGDLTPYRMTKLKNYVASSCLLQQLCLTCRTSRG